MRWQESRPMEADNMDVGPAVPCPPREGRATRIPLHKLDGGQGTARPTNHH